MVDISNKSTMLAALRGRVSVSTVPAHVPYDLVLKSRTTPIFEQNNLVVDTSGAVIVALMRGNYEDAAPAYISIGAGGDFTQTTKIDIGERVAPEVTDLSLRSVLARIPIVSTEDGTVPNEWTYVAVARPHEAITPVLNELGVEARDGTLVSHYVTEADSTGLSTRYCKTSLEYLVIRWTFRLDLLLNSDFVSVDPPTGQFLFTQNSLGESGLIPVGSVAGSLTPTAIPSINSLGVTGSIDVQPDDTIDSQLTSGSDAQIDLKDQ